MIKAIPIIAGILAAGAGAAAYLYYHPQIIISGIQRMLYKDGRPINSFEPFAPAMRRVKENGQLYVTEIQYGTEYPNSFLDISYPDEDTSAPRPTVIYFHGGGFFGGDKSMGDPTKDYCPSFLTAGNTDGFPEDMGAFAKRLEELGVEHEYYFTPREVCELPHGYLNLGKENEYARECFDHILTFMKKYTGGEDND